jgi:NADPH:quinone reductase-like Zn-dependent oxidoreductase
MMEPRNRVVRVSRFGAPEGLEVVDAPLPAAGRGEVRVRVLASSLNYTEVLIRRHLYPQTMRLRPPFVMGYDVVGEIDQIGDGVRNFQIGDRVADMTVVGSNSDYRTLRADDVARVPVGVDAAEAATLILSWTTAYQLLHRSARVQRGQRVLVHGAAGAVGQALLVLGRLAGLELWAPRAASTWRSSESWAQRRSTINVRTSRASCRAGSTSSSTALAKTAIAARTRRSSAAACSAPSASRQACRHSAACSQ